MPSKLKVLATHTFTEGLDSDSALEIISDKAYRYALNCHTLSTGNGQRGILTNAKGTTEIEFALPEGDNSCIGAKEDLESNQFYFLIWNSEGFHTIYRYDSLLTAVVIILQNLTDTADTDVLGFEEKGWVLHIDTVRAANGNILFYFAADYFKAKKFNVQKALDKSPAGYGVVILPEFINAYKLAAIFPPTLTYFTDTSRESNYLFGYLFKASVRHWYDDKERNNWSEFSTVPLPLNETPNTTVSNVNNALTISVETGSAIVTHIEIAVMISGEPFVSIIVLDKDKLGISDNTTYDYVWYNDNASYSSLDQLTVQRAYSYLPLNPGLQAFTQNALVYGKALEGFPVVDVLMAANVIYNTLFLPAGDPNELNSPQFDWTLIDYDFTREGHGRRRNSLIEVTVGFDVKAGNFFQVYGRNGDIGRRADNFFEGYTANNSDEAITVADVFKQRLFSSGRVLSSSAELPDTDIWDNDIDGQGNVTFRFIWKGVHDANATEFFGEVNQVSSATLKNGGQSVGNHKSGGTVKYGIIYWDDDTRRSNVYTVDAAVVRTDFVTETSGFQAVIHQISIMNQPPEWATYWELVRTEDLTYGNSWIQFLVQKAIESSSTSTTEYVDLIIGSLYTYQAMFPNTVVRYEFAKNDRVRLMRKEDSGDWYDFTETIVIDWKPVGFSETILDNVTVDGTATVVIGGATSADNIGRYIVIDGIEREITGAPTSSTYTIDRAFGTTAEDETFYSFDIVDKRGILRVRKPIGVDIEDNSLIEVYKPTQNVVSAQKTYYLFGQKYAILDPGTDDRAHTGNIQNQDPTDPIVTPAIVNVTKGTTYVRNRQLPTNNQIPGTQVIIDEIESQQYSDSYESSMNDNGKVAPEDEGHGQIRFDSRLRHGNLYLEGTGINGNNDFENLSRKDYYDNNGAIMLIKFREGLLYCFKQFRTFYTPIYANVITDQSGTGLLATSSTVFNQPQYFAWEGGIGQFPESYASNQTWQWFLSPNSGTDCRIGGDGVLPTSEQFLLDTPVQEYINNMIKYSGSVKGQFDRENGERIIAFSRYDEYLINESFNEAVWQLYHADYPEGTEYEITQHPAHGTVYINGDGDFVYTPDPGSGSGGGSDADGYTGPDNFYYRWRPPAGAWTEEKCSCGEVTAADIPVAPTTYYNSAVSEDFTTTCEEGSGSVVTYSVPAYRWSSPYSQAAADQLAADDILANGQAYADANGFCVRVLNLRYAVLEMDVCDADYLPVYIDVNYSDIQTDLVVYTDVNLTVPLTGFNFIVSAAGSIFNMSDTTGIVETDTTNTCAIVGVPLDLRYAVLEGDVCAATPTTVYVNPAYDDITTGVGVFEDAGMATQLEGYNYIVSLTGMIYEIDDYTGVVGADTESTCALDFEFHEITDNTGGAAQVTSANFFDGSSSETFLQPQLSNVPIADLPAGVYQIDLSLQGPYESIRVFGSGVSAPGGLCQVGNPGGGGSMVTFFSVTIPAGIDFYIILDTTACA